MNAKNTKEANKVDMECLKIFVKSTQSACPKIHYYLSYFYKSAFSLVLLNIKSVNRRIVNLHKQLVRFDNRTSDLLQTF